MDTNQQVIFVLILLTVATVVTVIVWFRAYRRNLSIEETGLDAKGDIYNTPND